MFDAGIERQLKDHFNKLAFPVELTASLDDSPAARRMETLLQDIADLSTQLTFQRDQGPALRRPSFEVRRAGSHTGVSFAAVPHGAEFTTLVLALLHVGGHPTKLEASVVERIQNLDGDYAFETYISHACHNCPDVVQTINAMSVINPRIRSMCIDGSLFRDEAEARNVQGVPMMFLNGQHVGQGRASVEEILALIENHTG